MRQVTATETLLAMFGPRAERLGHVLATTPGQLRVAMGVLWALAALFAWMNSIALERHRNEMQAIGKDSAPSIIAAQSIKSEIAALHGDTIRQFLGTAQQVIDARASYAGHRQRITDGLVAAARNITYGDDERIPIRDLLNGLASYDEAVGRANALRVNGGREYLPALRDATMIVDTRLSNNADLLDAANQTQMDKAYINDQDDAGWSTSYVVISSILLLAAMGGVQLLIHRRMHRRVSLPLLGAALVVVVWIFCVVNAMLNETNDLKVADKDAFDSIGAMWRARANAFDAQSHLSFALLDADSSSKARQVFEHDCSTLVQLPVGMTFESLQGSINQGEVPPGFQGEIAAELRNITFEGEKDAADEMLRQYAQYVAIAQKVIDTNQAGQNPQAVKLCLGDGRDQASGAMTAFDSALDRVLTINQAEFDRAVNRGFADVEGLWAWNYGVTLIILILSQLCIAQRLREYND